MPAIYSPLQNNNQLISEERKPTTSLPFNNLNDFLELERLNNHFFNELLSKYYKQVKIDVNEKDPLSLFQLAEIHFLKKHYARAEDYYKKVLKLMPSYLPTYDRLISTILTQFPKNELN